MTNWNEINCRTDCGLCNHKGTPSAMKGSKYCIHLRDGIPITSEWSIVQSLKKMFDMKGLMRKLGKLPKEEEEKQDGK